MSDPAKARSKPIRARVAPNKLVDGSNSEVPSAVHQAVVEETQVLNTIMGYIQNIDDLSYVLPASIAEGTEDDCHETRASMKSDSASTGAALVKPAGRMTDAARARALAELEAMEVDDDGNDDDDQ
ncbi:hypothetical protein B0H19DRAFT_1272804 [Mycena capillaripes]|nr:hypothetical protein B0H19DRAFT_1272804 [Mycena capillaripes]